MALKRNYSSDATEAAYEKKKAANERAFLRKVARVNSPEYKKEQQEKQTEKRERRLELIRSPEYQQQQREKQLANNEKKRLALVESPKVEPIKARKPKKKKGGMGLLGDRAPTAEERRVMDAIGKLPCIACYLHGKNSPVISLHHTHGRTAPNAHKKVLPLCDNHHQHAAPIEFRKLYPWLVPIHADGSVGGKAAFQRLNDQVDNLLRVTYRLAGLNTLIFELLGKQDE